MIKIFFVCHGISFLAPQPLINTKFLHGKFALRQVYDTNFG